MRTKSFVYLISLLMMIGLTACGDNQLGKLFEHDNCAVPGLSNPKTSEDFYKRAAKRMVESNDLSDEAIACNIADSSEAIKLDPKNSEAYILRGTSNLERKEYELALADINESIRLNPKLVEACFVRSLIQTDQGFIDEALNDLNKYIESVNRSGSPDDVAYSDRADIYFAKGEYEQAIKDYEEAIKIKIDNPEHLRNIAKVYRHLSKTVSATNSERSKRDSVYAERYEQRAIKLEQDEQQISPNSGRTVSQTNLPAGVVNIKAIVLPELVMPADAKAVIADGTVILKITVDEIGNLVSAKTVSGHQLLRAAAEKAALNVKFEVIKFEGNPVKAEGILVFNFVSTPISPSDK